jgi:hypothetical protein
LDTINDIDTLKDNGQDIAIYHTLETRKKINTQLKDSIKSLYSVLMRGVVEKAEVC